MCYNDQMQIELCCKTCKSMRRGFLAGKINISVILDYCLWYGDVRLFTCDCSVGRCMVQASAGLLFKTLHYSINTLDSTCYSVGIHVGAGVLSPKFRRGPQSFTLTSFSTIQAKKKIISLASCVWHILFSDVSTSCKILTSVQSISVIEHINYYWKVINQYSLIERLAQYDDQ
jgi:hypothetical protein